jgi:hypothetical protein
MRQDFYSDDLGKSLEILEEELAHQGQQITGVMGGRLPGETTWHITVVSARISTRPPARVAHVLTQNDYTDADQSDDERG